MTIANFWWLLMVACLMWYSTITFYVGVRGVWDIRNMLARLRDTHSAQEPEDAD